MSLFRTLDRTSAVTYNTTCTHARPFLTFLYPRLDTAIPRRSLSGRTRTKSPLNTHWDEHTNNFLIRALARVGSCRKHARHASSQHGTKLSTTSLPKARQKSTWQKSDGTKFFNSHSELKQSSSPLRNVKQFAKKELLALVDYYGIRLDSRPEEEPQDGGGLIWNVGDAHEPWPLRDQADAKHVKRLETLLRDDDSPREDVFETYKQLPSPGVVYLKTEVIRALLHHLSVVERPSVLAMQRFLSILDDMKTAHIHINRSEWTSAIYLAGNAMGRVSSDDVQTALYIWRDMEHRAGVKSSFVTLNVLFNLAVKAEKYELAETFLKELQIRKLPLTRHFRVSLIYYYGILQNGEAVRKAYQELVNAGDIVDTVVMNAVIAALIRAGEPSAAEHVFERMKRLHTTRKPAAPGHRFFTRTWQQRRLLGLHLTHKSREFSKMKDHDALKELQDYAPIAPDTRTYGLLIRHQTATTGDIDRVYALIREMRYNSVAIEGAIFVHIFQGFNTFGGVRYSDWTRDKLEKFWKQYLQALQDGLDRTWISVMAVIAALKAFAKCTDPDRTVKAWEEIRALWQPSEQELENVMKMLRKLVPSAETALFNDDD